MSYTGSIPDTTSHTSDWQTRAACLGRWDEMHPDNDVREIVNARAICKPCPVRRECFFDAIRTDDMQHGIRAGLRASERRAVAKELEQRAAAEVGDGIQFPQPKKPREPHPTSLAEAVGRRTERTDDGHLRWQGIAHVQFQGQRYTGLQAAFTVGYGREPQGLVRRTCTNANCVRSDHLTDEAIRDSEATCGTRDGYRRHRKNGETACPPCRQANTDADNRLRRTGTTKVTT